MRRLLVALFLVTASTQTYARGVDLRLADKTAELIYLTESSTFGYGGADVGLGVFFNEADDLMLSGTMMITGNSANNNSPFQFGVGFKLSGAKLDGPDEQVGALAVGGQLRYVIPSSTPIAFLAEGFVAPEITSFSEATQYSEYRFAVELEVTPSARAYVGFRHMQYELNNGPDYELDDDAHIGVRVEF